MSHVTRLRNIFLDQVISEDVILTAMALGRAWVFLVIKRWFTMRFMVRFHRVCFLLTLWGRCFWVWKVPFVVVRYVSWIGQNASNYGDEKADGWIAKDDCEPDSPIATILPRLLIINPLSVKGDTLEAHLDSWSQIEEDIVYAEICIETESDH